jgi:D-alanyl-D-alanine carboxypeptidase (penicillin-binding protein 5/6)
MQWQKIGLLFIIFSIGVQAHAAGLKCSINSESALLINSDTGKVLFAKNASRVMYPASCTKIPFALYAIKYHQGLFKKTLVGTQNTLSSFSEAEKSKNNFGDIPSYILETDASHMGLKVGEEMSFYDLLEATVVVSADDASNIIAEAMGGGSVDKCVQDVNAYLASIGCKNTHFTNPHGLHHPNHVTTAEDLAIMCREAMKEPLFAKMAKMTTFQRPQTNKQEPTLLRQTNRLLNKNSPYYYPYATGIKTGYHRRAGYCLAAQAEKDGRKLISVILHGSTGEERFNDTKKLFETAFRETLVQKEIFNAGAQSFQKEFKEGKQPLKTFTQEPIAYSFYPSEEPKARCQLVWHKVNLPLKKNTAVGELRLVADGTLQQTATLYAANDVELKFIYVLRKHIWLITLGGVVCITLLLILKKRKTQHYR